jgi:hypothetical protein
VKDIKKNQQIQMETDETLSEDHSKLCSTVVKKFHDEKAQQPAGVIDKNTGEFKDYFVWAGGSISNVADETEPGITF